MLCTPYHWLGGSSAYRALHIRRVAVPFVVSFGRVKAASRRIFAYGLLVVVLMAVKALIRVVFVFVWLRECSFLTYIQHLLVENAHSILLPV